MKSALAGTTVADRYDVIELVGAGGMGEVYRARDRELDELVALKLIRTDRADDPELVARFRHEVKLARRVTHVNVARTFELGYANGTMYCTMELIEGESLARRLSSQRRLSIPEATAIASAVCAGLTAAHAADVIHRDIKPDNILLASDRVVITDFGVAAVRVRGEGELSGTPAYMAPEQARGEPATPAADVYAVGLILYEMLTGRRAFNGELTQILSEKQDVERVMITPGEIPAELCEVVARATAREVTDRFGTADELRRALERWARPVRIATSPRVTHTRDELHPIVVLPPKPGADDSRLHIAKAIHEEVLARLSRKPMVRVMPRVEPVPGALVISLASGERLAATLSRDGTTLVELQLPLEVESIANSAQTIVEAGASAARSTERSPTPEQARALDLMLRARNLAASPATTGEAIPLAQQAAALAPDDPRVAATLAMLQVRVAFFIPDADVELLEKAAALARVAVLKAPELAESHLAMGHVALHTGEPAIASGHYRVAIACSPHVAEAHEYMGRMLVEAGFIDQGIARLEDALQITPTRSGCLFDIARAYALEGRWDEHARVIEAINQIPGDRAIARARFAWWRGDLVEVAEHQRALSSTRVFQPELFDAMFAAYVDNAWPRVGPMIMAAGLDETSPNRRRRAFVAQLAAESAAYGGDLDACTRLIDHAYRQGLFDLHWIEKCPMLDAYRASPAYPPMRARLKARADAILDALYGDHVVGTITETQIAPSALIR